ncbi:hypothetical protein, partial [Acinetobacter baumannii]|uniref:hypothetical protein n=1 Tax=Acinetobacter baumannii TaxID=470 RepID=UPI001CB863EA
MRLRDENHQLLPHDGVHEGILEVRGKPAKPKINPIDIESVLIGLDNIGPGSNTFCPNLCVLTAASA